VNPVLARLDAYEKLIRLDKPIGALLLLWPTLWALWMAATKMPPPLVLWIFILGTLLMRSAGCAINDFADRHYDAHVERTKSRPLAAGRIVPWEALVVAAALALCAFLLVRQLNDLTVKLSVGALAIAAIYPFTKRFFSMPQAFLGLAFGAGIPMAYAAIQNGVPAIAWVLVAANFSWVIAYDTEYAMVDRDDDRRIGIRTSAILFGRFDVAAVMFCYAIFLALMVYVGTSYRYGVTYYLGLMTAAAIVAWHYTLIRDRTRAGCFRAFRHNNWVGCVIFVGLALDRAPWMP
jgi:4-hydroxybenzoate polyprenyltransferase